MFRLAQALAGPAQRALQIPAAGRLDQATQNIKQRGVFAGQGLTATVGAPNPAPSPRRTAVFPDPDRSCSAPPR